MEVELKGMILYSEAKQKIEQDDAKGAFEKLHYALLHFAQLDSKKESLLTYVNLLDVLSTEIKESDFSQGNKQFYIKLFMTSERDIFLKMQKRKYYFVIKEIYDKLYFDLMKKVESFNEENNEQPY